MLRLINEVLTMGTPRRPASPPRCEEDSDRLVQVSQQERLALCAQRFAVRLEMRHGPTHRRHRAIPTRPARRALGLRLLERLLHPALQDGQRPVASPDDDKVIVSACESTPVRHRHRRPAPGPLLDQEPTVFACRTCWPATSAVDQFVGGTVYQAFLSATNYHRWHSPVAGTIVRAFIRGRHLLLRGRLRRHRRRRTDQLPVLPGPRRRTGDHPHRRRRSRSSAWWPSCRSACRTSPPASSVPQRHARATT